MPTKSAPVIAFQTGEEVTIVGAERECECSHCGRPLKLGIKLGGFPGVFGADCLAKAAAPYIYSSRKYLHKADALKEKGMIANKGAEYASRYYGMGTQHFKLTLKTELRSL